jgi:hypothetical protein
MAKDAVKECDRAIRGIKRKASRAKLQVLERCNDSVKLQAALVGIFAKDIGTAVWFLRFHARRAYFDQGVEWPDDHLEVTQMVQAMVEDDTIRRMSCDEHNSQVVKAKRWLAEWRLLIWLVHLNVRGIAPSSKELLEEYKGHLLSISGDGAHDHLEAVEHTATSKANWARTFRERWGLCYKTMMPGHEFTDEEICRRVRIGEKLLRECLFHLRPV